MSSYVPLPRPQKPMSLLEAMAVEEGFYLTEEQCKSIGQEFPTRPQRNNNPGDLRWALWQKAFGATSADDKGFAVYPTVEKGNEARAFLLARDYGGMTIAAAINKYAPPQENATNVYLANVLKMTGLSADTLVSDALKVG